MTLSDLNFIFQWWFVLFLIGVIFLPITTSIFSSFFDRGYIFAKVLATIILSYIIFVLGTVHLLRFTQLATTEILIILFILNLALMFRFPNLLISLRKSWKIFLFEELLFLATLLFWSYIRSFQPDIHGLEKYMDFGFVNSILRSEYFPPKDMWFTPFPINYYYFGHLYTAVLTKLSGIPSSITYNLMMATLFSLTFTGAFSIGATLMHQFKIQSANLADKITNQNLKIISAGILTAFLTTLAGNLHAIYSFFKPYINENPVPFWQLAFSPETFPNSYWYPNATRFIYNTIHEFPIYSFVVSDLHGHVLSIPIVLTIIAVLLHEFTQIRTQINTTKLILISFLLAAAYMTNVWDGIIYFLLSIIVLGILNFKCKFTIYDLLFTILLLATGFFIFSMPFSLNFKPFVSGIGVLCAPEFLTKIGSFGPFIFEPDHCQRSPFWQLLILYGFFYFWVLSFFVLLYKKLNAKRYTLNAGDIFILIFIGISTLLILLPELIYVKDIYPAHYRANTMFKLTYQAFIMFSIASSYIIIRIVLGIKYYVSSINLGKKILTTCYLLLATFLLVLVFIYPYFAINSYYGNLRVYYGLDGTTYLKSSYPTDYETILWLNKNIKGQPVVLEAQGDSYTDFARVSANTGLPTVLGWTVHEWLWRGSYNVPAPRIEEVKNLYESTDITLTKELLEKYKIELVFIGDLEHQKYQNLNEEKFQDLGKIIYQNDQTKIYKIQ